MDEPNWAKVLEIIYKSNNGEIWWPLEADDTEKTIDGTNLSQEKENDAINYLQKMDLLEKAEKDGGRVRQLTIDGFSVAHEREINQNQQKTNLGIGMLTMFLAIGSVMQGYSAYLNHDSTFNRLLLVVVLSIVVFSSIVIVGYMTGSDLNDVRTRLMNHISILAI